MEAFLPSKNHPRYMVGDRGTIKSTIRGGRILKPWIQSAHGKPAYLAIGLMNDDGSVARYLVHRLVAETFIPNPDNLPTINHKNGVKTDNNAINLEWVSYAENNEHARSAGLLKDFGETHYLATLTNAQVIKIRELAATGMSNRDIADRFSITTKRVYRIVRRLRWGRI